MNVFFVVLEASTEIANLVSCFEPLPRLQLMVSEPGTVSTMAGERLAVFRSMLKQRTQLIPAQFVES